MVWSFSFCLMPDEKIIEESSDRMHGVKIKPAYSVFLSNQRAIFRLDSLGSSMTQSFPYQEILGTRVSSRFLIRYLVIKTAHKESLLHVADAEYWARRILEVRETLKSQPPAPKPAERPVTVEMKRRALLDMLTVLRKNDLLTDEEFDEKVRRLSSLDIG